MPRAFALMMAVSVAACATARAARAQPAANIVATVSGWMECDECTNGELRSVVSLGNAAVPSLADLVQNGPPPQALMDKQQYLRQQYQQLVKYAQTHAQSKPTMTEDQTVQVYTRSYITLYRMRSARALGLIGTPEAKAALNRALLVPQLTAAEKAAITKALQ